MASTINVILGSAIALLVWTSIGLAVARAVLPERTLHGPVAPALGWAVHNAVTLPLFMLIGFNRATVTIIMLLSLAASAYVLWWQSRHDSNLSTAHSRESGNPESSSVVTGSPLSRGPSQERHLLYLANL